MKPASVQRRLEDFRAVLIELTAMAVNSLASCTSAETLVSPIVPESTSNSIH